MDAFLPDPALAPDYATDGPMRSARNRIFDLLRRELMGPYEGQNERFAGEYPTSRYIVGRLAPINQRISEEEDDRLGAGEEEEEAGDADEQLPLVLGFHPSSIGLSFILDEPCKFLDVRVTWGDYRREGDVEDSYETDGQSLPSEDQNEAVDTEATSKQAARSGSVWQRHPRETLVRQIAVPNPGRLRQIPLSQTRVPVGTIVDGFQDPGIVLEGVVHQVGLQRAVSLFLVNRRQKLVPTFLRR